MKTNFILIDFENVQPGSVALLRGGKFKIIVFLGATQAKLPADLACELQPLGTDAEYVRCAGSGPNALDFHIAYYIGLLQAEHPDATFHIVSKDKGFDPLIKHLKAKNIACHRWTSLASIPGVKHAGTAPAPAPAKAKAATGLSPVKRVMENLAKHATARPRTVKRLGSFIKTFLGAEATEAQIAEMVGDLERLGAVVIAGGKVSYPGST